MSSVRITNTDTSIATVTEVATSRRRIVVHDSDRDHLVFSSEPTIIRIIEPGIQGAVGATGYVSGALTPFYQINNSHVWYTTESLVLYDISSSIVPISNGTYVSSYSLGASSSAWQTLYIGSQSIKFVSPTEGVIASISAGNNFIEVGSSRISTSSFGLVNSGGYVFNIIKNQNSAELIITGSSIFESNGVDDIISVRSGSNNMFHITSDGVAVFANFDQLPTVVDGGMVKSGSSLFIGL